MQIRSETFRLWINSDNGREKSRSKHNKYILKHITLWIIRWCKHTFVGCLFLIILGIIILLPIYAWVFLFSPSILHQLCFREINYVIICDWLSDIWGYQKLEYQGGGRKWTWPMQIVTKCNHTVRFGSW